MTTLQIDSVFFRRRGQRSLLSDVSFVCNTGEIVAIVGRNGAGKTTLAELLLGINKVGTANVRVDGIYVPPVRRHRYITYLPQHSCFPKDATVNQLIRLCLRSQQADHFLLRHDWVRTIRKARVEELSAGQSRLLEILVLCARNSAFLILDEPFSRIDPITLQDIRDFLRQESRTKGIIAIDHNYRDLASIATKSLLLRDGQLIETTSENQLIDQDFLPRGP